MTSVRKLDRVTVVIPPDTCKDVYLPIYLHHIARMQRKCVAIFIRRIVMFSLLPWSYTINDRRFLSLSRIRFVHIHDDADSFRSAILALLCPMLQDFDMMI